MGLIVMRHVDNDTLEDLMDDNRHLDLDDVDLGVHVLMSDSEFGKAFNDKAKVIQAEVGNSKLGPFYHSATLRSTVTAYALAKKLGYTGEFIQDHNLEEHFGTHILRNTSQDNYAIAVGHQPSIAQAFNARSYYADAFRIEDLGYAFAARKLPNKLPEVKA